VFLPQMVVPVGGEVAVADEGAELEDGFGASQAPSRACDVEAVGDYMAACSFNDAGGDRPALPQGGGVVKVGLLGGEVGCESSRRPLRLPCRWGHDRPRPATGTPRRAGTADGAGRSGAR
jgi:hypothetical protein